jgi:uncharacterized membrane protein
MDAISGIALAAPAGLNAYIPLLAVAVGQRLGWLELRQPFDVMGEWWVIAIIAVLLVIELVADKVPAIDSVNDGIQTFVRPAAGGIVAVAASGDAQVNSIVMVVLGIVLAGGMHAAKAAARPVLNVSTGGTAAPAVSAAEDVGAVGMSALAIIAPFIAIVFMAAAGVWLWRKGRQTPGSA